MQYRTGQQLSVIRQLVTRYIPTRLLRGAFRNHVQIHDEYSSRWATTSSDILFGSRKLYPTILNGQLAILSGFEFIARHIRIVSQYIHKVKPNTVLELGSGNGLNLLALAVLHPEIKHLEGVELTEEGVRSAQQLCDKLPIDALMRICDVSSQEISKRLAGSRVTFRQGDITTLSQGSNSFDFVFTVFVLEQLPRTYELALKEARRVTNRHALFVEAFKEAQANITSRAYLWSRDYFCQSVRILERLGFELLEYIPLEFRKLTHGGGAALCTKSKL